MIPPIRIKNAAEGKTTRRTASAITSIVVRIVHVRFRALLQSIAAYEPRHDCPAPPKIA